MVQAKSETIKTNNLDKLHRTTPPTRQTSLSFYIVIGDQIGGC